MDVCKVFYKMKAEFGEEKKGIEQFKGLIEHLRGKMEIAKCTVP